MRSTPNAILTSIGLCTSIFLSVSCAASTAHRSVFAGNTTNNDNDDPTAEFRYFFGVTTTPEERRRGHNWSDQLEFDTNILSRDYVIFYQHLLGYYPKAGPHLAMDEEYMQAHLAKVASDVQAAIPDPNFSGIALIDFETFRAIWDRTPNIPSDEDETAHDHDFKDDWRDYIERTHPEFANMNEDDQELFLRDTYEDAVKNLFLQTLAVCREVRPHAKWGFHGYPIRFFKNRREAPTNVISYDDGSHNGSRLNDRLQWMWDAEDVISPSIYPPRVVAAPGEDICEDQCSAAEEVEFIQNMIREARRVSNGKPVIPAIANIYNTPHDCLYGQDVADETLYDEIMIPALAGADGVTLWGNLTSRSDMQHWQWLLDHKMLPLMKQSLDNNRSNDDSNNNMANNDNNANDNLHESQSSASSTVHSIRKKKDTSYSTKLFRAKQKRKVRMLINPNRMGSYRLSKPLLRHSTTRLHSKSHDHQ